MDHFDAVIIGAGVVGLAAAQRLSDTLFPGDSRTLVIEQNSGFGQETSSRNSEVIHAGIYYPKDSIKARLCVRGKELLYPFCQRYQVPHQRLGKYIVANQDETPELERLLKAAQGNGVEDLILVDHQELARNEPAVSASAALFSPSSGIIDSHAYMDTLLRLAQENGCVYSPLTRFVSASRSNDKFVIECAVLGNESRQTSQKFRFTASFVINSAGLQAVDASGAIDGIESSSLPRQYYCKGDYFSYSHRSPFKHLIYPVPESNTVGLGIHATLDLSGRVRFGPDTEYVDAPVYTVCPSKAQSFAASISRYFPAIKAEDLAPDYAGVRPKLSAPGDPAADFMIEDVNTHRVPGLIQLFGMESPGLTASLAIAEEVEALIRATC